MPFESINTSGISEEQRKKQQQEEEERLKASNRDAVALSLLETGPGVFDPDAPLEPQMIEEVTENPTHEEYLEPLPEGTVRLGGDSFYTDVPLEPEAATDELIEPYSDPFTLGVVENIHTGHDHNLLTPEQDGIDLSDEHGGHHF